MRRVNISINTIEKVKDFVNLVSTYDSTFNLVAGRYVIDAKSIMGVFSMNLSKPVVLQIHDDSVDINDFKEYLI